MSGDVEAYIARHGVTRCPTAFAAPSTATISDADAASHRARVLDSAEESSSWRNSAKAHGWARYWALKRQREGKT